MDSFRAVIVGGGPVGLAMGNMLAAANIDFVILERHTAIVTVSGAGIVLLPHAARTFDQLGLLEALNRKFVPVQSKETYTLDGKFIRSFPLFSMLEDNHGYDSKGVCRTDLTQVLYDGLKDHIHRIKTGVIIEDIEMNDSRVRVRLGDGSVEEGSIVIGADGVHSQVRDLMWKLAKEAPSTSAAESAGKDLEKMEDPIVSNFQVLYGRARYIEGLKKGVFFETHGTHMSTQITASDDQMFFGLFRPTPEPTTVRKIYSDEETDEFFEAFADVAVMPNLTVQELRKHCEWTRLVNQHEGFMKHWYHDRIVLVGDSAVQMTSAGGMGFNTALQSAVVLSNKLHEVVTESASSNNKGPSMEALVQVFSEYQQLRQEESRVTSDVSMRIVRGNTWEGWFSWFLTEYMVPWLIGDRKIVEQLGTDIISRARSLSYIRKDVRSGKMQWVQS